MALVCFTESRNRVSYALHSSVNARGIYNIKEDIKK